MHFTLYLKKITFKVWTPVKYLRVLQGGATNLPLLDSCNKEKQTRVFERVKHNKLDPQQAVLCFCFLCDPAANTSTMEPLKGFSCPRADLIRNLEHRSGTKTCDHNGWQWTSPCSFLLPCTSESIDICSEHLLLSPLYFLLRWLYPDIPQDPQKFASYLVKQMSPCSRAVIPLNTSIVGWNEKTIYED